jgi:acetyl esterase/lipase
MDPELAAVVAHLPLFEPGAAMDSRARARAYSADRSAAPGRSALRITEEVVPGASGRDPVPVRIYRPSGDAGPRPAAVYLHGGGFVAGDLDTEDLRCVRLAHDGGCVVVSVDYRLAPEHRFPAPLDDCYAALCWTAAGASDLGVDPHRIGVVGASSGANLAAATALLARDRGGPTVAFQCLVYPTLDDRMETASVRFVGTPIVDGSDVARCWGYYLGDNRDDVSPYAAPGRATDLRGLPPAYVMTAELDPLRDDGLRYAARLLEAGVSVELHQFAGAFHGFDLFPTAISRRALDEQVTWVVAVTTNGSSGS